MDQIMDASEKKEQGVYMASSIMNDDRLKLSTRVVLSMLVDRMKSSVKSEDFFDNVENEYYVIYTYNELANQLHISRNTVGNCISELRKFNIIKTKAQMNSALKIFIHRKDQRLHNFYAGLAQKIDNNQYINQYKYITKETIVTVKGNYNNKIIIKHNYKAMHQSKNKKLFNFDHVKTFKPFKHFKYVKASFNKHNLNKINNSQKTAKKSTHTKSRVKLSANANTNVKTANNSNKSLNTTKITNIDINSKDYTKYVVHGLTKSGLSKEFINALFKYSRSPQEVFEYGGMIFKAKKQAEKQVKSRHESMDTYDFMFESNSQLSKNAKDAFVNTMIACNVKPVRNKKGYLYKTLVNCFKTAATTINIPILSL